MSLVVDASVALKWFLADEPGAGAAQAILQSPESLIAPDLIIAEACNAAWLGVRAGRVAMVQAEALARLLPGMFEMLISGSPLAERALAIAAKLDHPAYDCFYLALAERRDSFLVTADQRLLRKTASTAWADRVQSLSDRSTP